MDLLIVGDVHGCYHTFKSLIEDHWKAGDELLIQIGDLVNKGPHSGQCLSYWKKLEKKYPDHTLLIRGNHEQFLINGGEFLKETIKGTTLEESIIAAGMKVSKVQKWLSQKPLKWENDYLLVTHAGISKTAFDPYSINSRDGVLFNKGALKRLDKIQVKGHSIVDGHKPVFSTAENAWYIDTGAWGKKYLSAIRFSEEGEMLKVIRVQTQAEDRLR